MLCFHHRFYVCITSKLLYGLYAHTNVTVWPNVLDANIKLLWNTAFYLPTHGQPWLVGMHAMIRSRVVVTHSLTFHTIILIMSNSGCKVNLKCYPRIRFFHIYFLSVGKSRPFQANQFCSDLVQNSSIPFIQLNFTM